MKKLMKVLGLRLDQAEIPSDILERITAEGYTFERFDPKSADEVLDFWEKHLGELPDEAAVFLRPDVIIRKLLDAGAIVLYIHPVSGELRRVTDVIVKDEPWPPRETSTGDSDCG